MHSKSLMGLRDKVCALTTRNRSTRSRTSLPRSIHACVVGSAISSMPIGIPSRPSTALFVAVCERSCADSFIVRPRVDAFAITRDGRTPSSLILGSSRRPRPFDWAANPDVDTTDWRARRENCAPGSEGGDGARRFLPLSVDQKDAAHGCRPSDWKGAKWLLTGNSNAPCRPITAPAMQDERASGSDEVTRALRGIHR
jgi:hypothetical protein